MLLTLLGTASRVAVLVVPPVRAGDLLRVGLRRAVLRALEVCWSLARVLMSVGFRGVGGAALDGCDWSPLKLCNLMTSISLPLLA